HLLALCLTAPALPHSCTFSLHDALPISVPTHLLNNLGRRIRMRKKIPVMKTKLLAPRIKEEYLYRACLTRKMKTISKYPLTILQDRKSTRLNSSHVKISYAVFCLKKRKE